METKKEADIKRKLKRSRGKTKSKMIALADSIQFKSNPRVISIFISNPSMDLSGLYKVVQVKPISTPLRHPVIEEESFKQNAPKLLLPVLSHTDTGGANEAISHCRCVCTSWAACWLYICVCFHKYIPFLWISIHTSSPSVHNSIIPLIMLQPQKWYLLFLSPHHFYQSPSSSNSSAHALPVQWWMCTAAACGQWNSTVYTYHIHLINPNEVSTGLLFTMHCWAAAARHGATTHTHSDTHAHRQRCHQQCQQSHSVSAGEREAHCFLGAEVILPSDHRQTDPWGSIW